MQSLLEASDNTNDWMENVDSTKCNLSIQNTVKIYWTSTCTNAKTVFLFYVNKKN